MSFPRNHGDICFLTNMREGGQKEEEDARGREDRRNGRTDGSMKDGKERNGSKEKEESRDGRMGPQLSHRQKSEFLLKHEVPPPLLHHRSPSHLPRAISSLAPSSSAF